MLEGAGYRWSEAEDGMVALERYFVEKPDLVLLDLVMKGMYGLDVLSKLRELDPAARVIVLSADIQTSSREMVSDGRCRGIPQQAGGARRDLLTAVDAALEGEA